MRKTKRSQQAPGLATTDLIGHLQITDTSTWAWYGLDDEPAPASSVDWAALGGQAFRLRVSARAHGDAVTRDVYAGIRVGSRPSSVGIRALQAGEGIPRDLDGLVATEAAALAAISSIGVGRARRARPVEIRDLIIRSAAGGRRVSAVDEVEWVAAPFDPVVGVRVGDRDRWVGLLTVSRAPELVDDDRWWDRLVALPLGPPMEMSVAGTIHADSQGAQVEAVVRVAVAARGPGECIDRLLDVGRDLHELGVEVVPCFEPRNALRELVPGERWEVGGYHQRLVLAAATVVDLDEDPAADSPDANDEAEPVEAVSVGGPPTPSWSASGRSA